MNNLGKETDNLGRKMTFWSLINEVSICIPIIQRDYVQGRKKDQVIDARRNLLQEMREAIIVNGSLDLNFVYGKEHERYGEKFFTPLDGQQRLTTLFLLHWFALAKIGDIEKAKILQRFSYETRTSSRKFIEQLVKNISSLSDVVIDTNIKISDYIKNEAWFWVDWVYDPTIDSILLMLDEIKERFISIDDLADKLTLGSSISFRYLNMKDLGMEDSLYIKLNARGRELTDFENFKAELVKYVKEEVTCGTINESIAKDFATKLDGQWTDLFWQWTSGNKEDFDRIYMNCFHWMLWNRWAEIQKQVTKSNFTITSAMNRTAYYRLKSYKDYGAIDRKVLEDLYYTLDYFSPLDNAVRTEPCNGIVYLKNCTVGFGTTVTYEDRVMMFSVTCYIGSKMGNVDPKEFNDWLRIFGNLVRNTRLDGLDDFIRGIQSIASLSDHSSNLLEYFASPGCTVGGFLSEQIEEERLKAKLILYDRGWADAIYDAEKHPYFAGQIAFLLSFSGLNLQTVDNLDDTKLDECLNNFNKYKKKMTALFGIKGLTIDNELFSRAILSKGDYLLPFRSCKSFLIDSHRDISWKTLLRNSNSDKRAFLKAVLDELDENDLSLKNIKRQLNEIIDKSTINDWRHYFVKTCELLKECGYYRLIYISGQRILLVSCQTTAGYNKEYYTYVLYLKLQSLGRKPHYTCDRGQYGEMFIDKLDGKELMINYKKCQNAIETSANWKFQIDQNGEKPHYEKTVEDVFNYINTI
jgi:hypothetical protein